MTSGVNVPLIELINAGIEDRNGVRQINGITFNVTRGEFVCLQGPTGSGKSLALNMIAGIKRPSFGQIFVAGDCRKGQSLVVYALAEGRACAQSVYQHLMALPCQRSA